MNGITVATNELQFCNLSRMYDSQKSVSSNGTFTSFVHVRLDISSSMARLQRSIDEEIGKFTATPSLVIARCPAYVVVDFEPRIPYKSGAVLEKNHQLQSALHRENQRSSYSNSQLKKFEHIQSHGL